MAADGYDGGPFFSPDEKMICYRSDRQLNDLLQIYVDHRIEVVRRRTEYRRTRRQDRRPR